MPSTRRNFLLKACHLVLAGPLLVNRLGAETFYTVKKGDTLGQIALNHGVTLSQLRTANRIKGDIILIGQKLVIPESVKTSQDLSHILEGVQVKRGRWKYIVGHHSATKYGNAEIYDRNHRRRGMQNGLAYHFVIGNGIDSPDGKIEIGPRWKKQLDGGHVRSHKVNATGIGICVVGNFEETRPSTKQMAAFTSLVDFLGNNLLKGSYSFNVHKEIDKNHTVCPGRYFPVKAMHRRFG